MIVTQFTTVSRRLRDRLQTWWRSSARTPVHHAASGPPQQGAPGQVALEQVAIPAADPLGAYLLANPWPVRVDELRLDSPLLDRLAAAGVQMVVPLVTQGELIGVFNLGGRRSQQDYSSDDRKLLSNLAAQTAPAVRIAQLVKQQQAEIRARERLEQEMQVARLIQQTLLPKDVPALPGWHLAAYYRPARAVGGDFYDFLTFEDGRVGLVLGDVSDKGVPAALVMATTRSILRSAAVGADGVRPLSPGAVLERTNDLLCPDIPPKMFVTCLYAILDPQSGRMVFANAGQDLPYCRHQGSVTELRARGMPLGLMPGMRYEEHECTLAPGDSVLVHSDGVVEAHNPAREMFGEQRLTAVVGVHDDDGSRDHQPLIDFLLEQLTAFVGTDWEQEDDITMVTLHRSPREKAGALITASTGATDAAAVTAARQLPELAPAPELPRSC